MKEGRKNKLYKKLFSEYKMSELAIAPITAVILGLVLSIDVYNKAVNDLVSQETAQRLLYIIIALSVFLLIAIIGILFRPTYPGARSLFTIVGVIALIVALTYAWLNYINNSGKKFAVETLIIALVVSVPILVTLLNRDTISIRLNL
jgi:hypothetical protein